MTLQKAKQAMVWGGGVGQVWAGVLVRCLVFPYIIIGIRNIYNIYIYTIYIHIYICKNTYIYIYVYIHKYIYIHIYVFALLCYQVLVVYDWIGIGSSLECSRICMRY